MTDLAIVVEGETEELFVTRVLRRALLTNDIYAWPDIARGSKSWNRVRRDIEKLLKGMRGRYCAIMFDYYGLPRDWPGRVAAEQQPIEQRAQFVENALIADLTSHLGESFRNELFIPHIQLHEYEAKLFSDCATLATVLGVRVESLEEIVRACGSPEQINDSEETAPSKRLEQLCITESNRGYRKTTDGVTAAENITLPRMRAACPHFALWLSKLEGIAPADGAK